MENRTRWIIGCIALSLLVIALLFAFASSVFGPSGGSITARLNEIGVARIEREAMGLIVAGQKGSLDPKAYPTAISELYPRDVGVVDGELVVIVLKEFNGAAETGVYVYRDSSTPRRKDEIHHMNDTVVIYKMLD